MINKFLQNNYLRIGFPLLFGGILGFAYYYFIGCNAGGSCPITSNPWVSVVYGLALGGLLIPNKKSRG